MPTNYNSYMDTGKSKSCYVNQFFNSGVYFGETLAGRRGVSRHFDKLREI
jgi:hypothetical protein